MEPRKADSVDSLEEGADAMDGAGPGDGDACASCHGGVHGREDAMLREMMAGDLMALCEQEKAVRAGDEPGEGHDELGEGMEAADARRQAIEWWREACARKGDATQLVSELARWGALRGLRQALAEGRTKPLGKTVGLRPASASRIFVRGGAHLPVPRTCVVVVADLFLSSLVRGGAVLPVPGYAEKRRRLCMKRGVCTRACAYASVCRYRRILAGTGTGIARAPRVWRRGRGLRAV